MRKLKLFGAFVGMAVMLSAGVMAQAKEIDPMKVVSKYKAQKEEVVVNLKTKSVTSDGVKTTIRDEFGTNSSDKKTIENAAKEEDFVVVEENDDEIVFESVFCNMRIFVEGDVTNDKAVECIPFHGYTILQFTSIEDTREAYEMYSATDKNVVIDKNIHPQMMRIRDEEKGFFSNKAIRNSGLDVMQENLDAVKRDTVVALIDSGVENEELDKRLLPGVNYSGVGNATDVSDNYLDINGYRVGHGTSVASVIVDATNKHVKVLPIKIIDKDETTTVLAVECALSYAINKGVDVINMSFGVENLENNEIEMLSKLIDEAIDNNIPVVCSGGNDEGNVNQYFPSCYKPCWVVSANEHLEELKWCNGDIDFSFEGSNVVTLRPGIDLYSLKGSSCSSGFLAAMTASYKTMYDYTSVDMLYEVIKRSCIDIGEPGYDQYNGWGQPKYTLGNENPCNKEHFENKEVKKIPATCKAEGSIEYECTYCKKHTTKKLPIDKDNHVSLKETKVEGDCEHDAYTLYTCKSCNKEAKRIVTTLATGHTWRKINHTTEYNVSAKGKITQNMVSSRKCSACKKTETINSTTKNIKTSKKIAKAKISNLKTKRRIVTVSVKKQNCDGYFVQYTQGKSFKNAKVKKIAKKSMKTPKLKKGKTCRVRVCAYRETKDGIVCGKWSKKKTIKVK